MLRREILRNAESPLEEKKNHSSAWLYHVDASMYSKTLYFLFSSQPANPMETKRKKKRNYTRKSPVRVP